MSASVSSASELLKYSLPTDEITSPMHGLFASLVGPNRSFYITTPNSRSSEIPDPPLGTDRLIQMRDDGFYGPDDPTIWPQRYDPKYPQLIAIPLRPYKLEHRYYEQRCMWEPLSDACIDIEDGGTGLIKVGSVNQPVMHEMKAAMIATNTRLASLKANEDEKWKKYAEYINMCIMIQTMCYTRLENGVATPRDLRRDHAELRRMWLILQGFIDYVDIHYPRMRSLRMGQSFTQRKPDRIMGAFVTSIVDAEFLFVAGAPLWLLRHTSTFHTERPRIQTLGTIKPFSGVEAHAIPPWPIIYEGGSGDSAKTHAIVLAARRSFQHLTLFDGPRVSSALPSSAVYNYPDARPASGPARTAGHSKRPTPLSHPPSRSNEDIRRFEASRTPLAGMYAPTPIWPRANASIKRLSEAACRRQVDVQDQGYYFPAPSKVIEGEPFRVQGSLRVVKHLKLGFLARLRYDTQPMSKNQWERVLNLGITRNRPAPAEDGELSHPYDRNGKASTRKDKVEEAIVEVRKWMKGQTLPGAEPQYQPSITVTKADYHLHPIEALEGKRIMYKLCEYNFRWELMALDAHLADRSVSVRNVCIWDDPKEVWKWRRQQLINCCIPSESVIDVRYDRARQGLGAPEMQERLQYLRAFWTIMDSWKTAKPARWRMVEDYQSDPLIKFSIPELEEWEVEMAAYYAQTFYDVFGRAPVLPHTI